MTGKYAVPTIMENSTFENRHSEGLRKDALPFSETLAQSVANIAPTATPAVNLGLVFASAGGGTWFTYLIATVGLLFISMNIGQFAKRSATPGSLYAYVSKALGPGAGFTTGWALILAYLTTAFAVVAGFANYGGALLANIGITLPPYVYFLFCAITIFLVVYKDVSLSARLMLGIEAISVSVIFILGILAVSKKGFDSSQLALTGLTASGLRTGLVLGIFSYVGFESATAMGAEAKDPLKTVPKAVWMSTLISGTFFVIMSFLMVSSFAGGKYPDAPISGLAQVAGMPGIGVLAEALATFSLFACALACTTAVSRILMAMGRDGLIHVSMGTTHDKNETPHMAAAACAVLLFLVPSMMALGGIGVLDIYGLNGTIATYGFLISYILIPIGSILYLNKIKEPSMENTVCAVLGISFMMMAVYGSVLPYPAGIYGWLPIAFAIYMAIGGVCWLMSKGTVQSLAAASASLMDDTEMEAV